MTALIPFTIAFPEADLDDLRERLSRTADRTPRPSGDGHRRPLGLSARPLRILAYG